ncbi:hypothetical protein FHW67_000004 [Herbaspirillum sp. Sphag1AN]|uniref:hypothetical protein n=1 Tax=unclassified Herbaspirillum TaxID=2624150 RepID=UPI00161E179A|nr:MULTISPECIES: hypothetical protein [unclassified Herbaspirillum]MBB3210769.1 hypothetical protein [Herbaspirillum sp. Sphag1AN]MBB3244399.1 hypothetical protein [Herbaspirillum sp. Sphag64]
MYISPIRSKDKPDEPIVWGFGLACHAGATRDEIDDLLGARKLKDQWFWTGTNAPFEENQNFRLIEFSGKNWTGIGNTNDQITGEETLRQRFFNFCLLQTDGSQVLCVCNLQVMNLNHPESNILEKVIAVLNSIEFVNLPAHEN